MYLVSITLIFYINSVNSYSVPYTNLGATYLSLGNLLLCIAVAYIMVVAFEFPILHMEKLLFVPLGLHKLPPLPSQTKENIVISSAITKLPNEDASSSPIEDGTMKVPQSIKDKIDSVKE